MGEMIDGMIEGRMTKTEVMEGMERMREEYWIEHYDEMIFRESFIFIGEEEVDVKKVEQVTKKGEEERKKKMSEILDEMMKGKMKKTEVIERMERMRKLWQDERKYSILGERLKEG